MAERGARDRGRGDDGVVTALQALGLLVVSGLLALGGMLLVRRSVELSSLESHREYAGFIYATIGVMYGVLMSFVTIVVWQAYSQAQQTVESEVESASVMYHLAEGFSDSSRDRIQGLIRGYADAVVHDEWPAMAHGQQSQKAWGFSDQLWETYINMPDPDRQREVYAQSLTEMDEFYGLRSQRLLYLSDRVPPVVWAVLIGGAVITISFTYLFGVRNVKSQAMITLALTVTITGILFLIYTLDAPLTGSQRIGPDAFQSLIGLFQALKH
jgi:hypothetical protein